MPGAARIKNRRWITAMCSGPRKWRVAATKLSALSPSESAPTTRVQRLISVELRVDRSAQAPLMEQPTCLSHCVQDLESYKWDIADETITFDGRNMYWPSFVS